MKPGTVRHIKWFPVANHVKLIDESKPGMTKRQSRRRHVEQREMLRSHKERKSYITAERCNAGNWLCRHGLVYHTIV